MATHSATKQEWLECHGQPSQKRRDLAVGLVVKLYYPNEIWQAPWQQCYWDACQIPERQTSIYYTTYLIHS